MKKINFLLLEVLCVMLFISPVIAQTAASVAGRVRSACQGAIDEARRAAVEYDRDTSRNVLGYRSGRYITEMEKMISGAYSEANTTEWLAMYSASEIRNALADENRRVELNRRRAIEEKSVYYVYNGAIWNLRRCAIEQLAGLKTGETAASEIRPSVQPSRQEAIAQPSSATSTEAVNQSLALAQQNQSRGDEQARKDGRKRNDSAYEAHNCLSPGDLDNPSSFGSLRNSCNYKVEFHFCVVRPNASAWSTAFDCEKQSFGGGSAGPGGRGPVQIKGAQSVLWFACRSPAIVVDQRYDAARGGVTGRCRVIGG